MPARPEWERLEWSGIGGGLGVLIFVALVATASALFALRGPAAVYDPPGLPHLLLTIAHAPAELALVFCPWVGDMFLYPATSLLGWTALGIVVGELALRIARWKGRKARQ